MKLSIDVEWYARSTFNIEWQLYRMIFIILSIFIEGNLASNMVWGTCLLESTKK